MLDTYQPMTPPASQDGELRESSAATPPILAFGLATNDSEARWTRRTADDLAQEEAISSQAVGKRHRIKKVKFAE